ncbi:MAG: arginine--tRNA ligase [Thaumarchaeota archaeon]|nr:arginine--tRNA ligase [Nitrososphaerota archaeon]
MTLYKYKLEIENGIKEGLKKLNLSEMNFQVRETTNPEYGELYSNLPFVLAKKLKKNPIEIAEKLVKNIKINKSIKIEVQKPGYINFRIDYEILCYESIKNTIEEPINIINLGQGKKIILEHTSVNPNKALHIGHARNLFIGDALSKMLKKTGHQVKIMNYIDDSGLQVADLIVGFKYAKMSDEPPDNIKFDSYAGDNVYVKINELYKEKPELLEKRKQILQELEKESEIQKYAQKITTRILKNQLETSWRLGAFYDLLVFESHIIFSKNWKDIFEKMKKLKIVELETKGELAGAWIIKVKNKEESDKVIVRSDGTSTYIAKDIVLASWKIGLIKDIFNYKIYGKQLNQKELWCTAINQHNNNHPEFTDNNTAITIIDARQNRLQKIIQNILNELNNYKNSKEYLHLPYEVVTLSKKTAISLGFKIENNETIHMSGRKGTYINVDTAVNFIKNKAIQETKSRNPEKSIEWINDISEKISLAAFRYELLKQDLNKLIIFDIENSLRLDGETGPYLLYSYARASRIIEKSGFEPKINNNISNSLSQDHEKNLVKTLSKLNLIIEESIRNTSPMRLSKFAFTLSSNFNSFYEKSNVLHEQNDNIKNARLALVYSFRNTIKLILEMIGINTLEKI